MEIYTGTTRVNNIMSLKASIVYDFSILQVFATLHDERYRQAYDTDIADTRLLKKVAANTYVIY